MNIPNLISNEITDKEHYLYRAQNSSELFYKNFLDIVEVLRKQLLPKDFTGLLVDKLQLKKGIFKEKPFIQSACETTVTSYFAKYFQDKFCYEKRVSPDSKKNVECQFGIDKYVFNIEVKCPDYSAKEIIDSRDALKIGTIGRLPDHQREISEVSALLERGQEIKGGKSEQILTSRNMDNTLKDFLVSAHNKFNPNASQDEVNILVVCCSDQHDIQSWWGYMYAWEGLFTRNTFYDHNEFNLVDIVVLSNLYHRHHKYFEKPHLQNIWNFENAFSLAFSNPHRKLEKKNSIMKFLNTFPHYGWELQKYQVPGNAENFIKDTMRISYFVKDELIDKGIVLF